MTGLNLDGKNTIIFDLDGTLVDIEPVFIRIFNTLAGEFGYTPIRLEEIPRLKKLHLKSLIWKRLGLRIFLFPLILKRGREEYRKRITEVALFPGVKELIDTLRSHGYSVGIASSSEEDIITALMEKFTIPTDFIYHCGLFNKSKILRQAMKERRLILSETLYIGDEVRDVEACQKINLDIISVSWGLNSKEALQAAGARIIAETPLLLLDMLIRNR